MYTPYVNKVMDNKRKITRGYNDFDILFPSDYNSEQRVYTNEDLKTMQA